MPSELSLIPTDEMSNGQKKIAQKNRSDKYGIAALDNKGERLSFPPKFPTTLDQYGDPVNLLFPISPASRATNARVRFKQYANNIYDDNKSKKIVHTRIVEAELGYGSKPKYEDDDLDKLLPEATKKRMEGYSSSEESMDVAGVKAKIKKMVSDGISLGDDYEPRVRFLTTYDKKSKTDTSATNIAIKIAKGKYANLDNMSFDRVTTLVERTVRINYFLFGPFDPPRYECDKPENHVSVRSIFPGGSCIVSNYQCGRFWKVSYKITPDVQGHYIAEIIGTPIPVEFDNFDAYKEIASVAKSVSSVIEFGNVENCVVVNDKGLFSGVLGTSSILEIPL